MISIRRCAQKSIQRMQTGETRGGGGGAECFTLTHQWIPSFPPKLPTQELNHGLEVIRNCHSKEVLLHYRRVSNRFEAHDNYRKRTRVHTSRFSQSRERSDVCRVCMAHPNLLWDLSSCRILEQRDPLQGPHQLQDLGRTMRVISGWRLVSAPCKCHGAALRRTSTNALPLFPARFGNCRPANETAFD
jgi:hypothetical protein